MKGAQTSHATKPAGISTQRATLCRRPTRTPAILEFSGHTRILSGSTAGRLPVP
jgi:hypothetical protein